VRRRPTTQQSESLPADPAAKRARIPWFARWLVSAPTRWLGTGSSVEQNLTGGTHGLSYLRNLARGNRIRRQASFEKVDDRHPPVLLIHGFLGTRGSLFPLERRLVAEGLCVFSFNLGALNSRDIRASAFLIHRKIESILSQTSVERIDIVGHSMGGLIGLYYLKKLGGHSRVRRLIMMGTPVKGTWAALAGVLTLGLWSKSSWQLLPRSKFLDELNQGPLPPDVEIYTLAAVRDWVCPLPSTRLQGATAVTVPLGHSSLVISDEVFTRIKTILRSPQRAARIATADSAIVDGELTSNTEPASAENIPRVVAGRRPARGARR